MAENLGWEFMSYALIFFVHSLLDRSDMKGKGGSKYISDRRKITKIEGKMKLKKGTYWRVKKS
jgi:hypothetical protein